MPGAAWQTSRPAALWGPMPPSPSFSSAAPELQRQQPPPRLAGPPTSVAEDLYRVELTASFLQRLDAIEAFLTEADAAFAFDDLLAELRATVFPNLARFPRIGRRYLDNPPQSAEALAQLAALPAGAATRRQFEAVACSGWIRRVDRFRSAMAQARRTLMSREVV